MNFNFRANDQLPICLLLLCVTAWIGIRFTSINGMPFHQAGTAIEYDKAARRTYRFELDVNTASWSELTLLPGIGERLANRIVAYRDQKGGIRDLDELVDVDGIGGKKLEAIRGFLRTNPIEMNLPTRRNGV